ncbi:MAG: DUF4250 domain-containing protein [Paramuribaculum sp.]|nr:DUF4250 domain-containing protein [Paramuribaculum sp.]MDE6651051.1 DUF4250 domain-containing protein [Paramuribaculum sp.]
MENDFSKLPADPAMLMSFVNMKLRDCYDSLEDLCDDMNFDVDSFVNFMQSKGWEYNKDGKKFW